MCQLEYHRRKRHAVPSTNLKLTSSSRRLDNGATYACTDIMQSALVHSRAECTSMIRPPRRHCCQLRMWRNTEDLVQPPSMLIVARDPDASRWIVCSSRRRCGSCPVVCCFRTLLQLFTDEPALWDSDPFSQANTHEHDCAAISD